MKEHVLILCATVGEKQAFLMNASSEGRNVSITRGLVETETQIAKTLIVGENLKGLRIKRIVLAGKIYLLQEPS